MIQEAYEAIKGGIGAIKNSTKSAVVDSFRKLNKVCVILDDDMIYLVNNRNNDGVHTIARKAMSEGFVELKVYAEGEKYRLVPYSRIKEFTLGTKSNVDDYFTKKSKELNSRVMSTAGSLNPSSSFNNQNP